MQLIRHAPSLRQGCDIYRSAVGEVTDRRSVHRQAFSPQAGGRSVAGWRSVLSLGSVRILE